VAVLDPNVVLRADRHPDFRPGRYQVAGATGVAELVLKRGTPFAPLARHTILDGHAGAAVVTDGRLRSLVRFTVRDGRVTALDLVIDPDTLARLRV
jgi:RNA polymerase sigma-70 factor (ECF subfamily)